VFTAIHESHLLATPVFVAPLARVSMAVGVDGLFRRCTGVTTPAVHLVLRSYHVDPYTKAFRSGFIHLFRKQSDFVVMTS
jgi:hypothetical protein